MFSPVLVFLYIQKFINWLGKKACRSSSEMPYTEWKEEQCDRRKDKMETSDIFRKGQVCIRHPITLGLCHEKCRYRVLDKGEAPQASGLKGLWRPKTQICFAASFLLSMIVVEILTIDVQRLRLLLTWLISFDLSGESLYLENRWNLTGFTFCKCIIIPADAVSCGFFFRMIRSCVSEYPKHNC